MHTNWYEYVRYGRLAAALENSRKIDAVTLRKQMLFVLKILRVCPYLSLPKWNN